MLDLPWTPDFDVWPITHSIVSVHIEGQALRLVWSDGRQCLFHAFLLRENSPDADTIHPLSREAVISPEDMPDDLSARTAVIDAAGALAVEWSPDGHRSRYHPGWLRAHAWFGDAAEDDTRVFWTPAEQPLPPTFDGPAALSDDRVFLAWLEALRDYGVARLETLPQQDGLLERIVTRIGPIRESNFQRLFTLEVKDVPDSNAYTSDSLPQHIDMPTRECPMGLQFLYCRENSTFGGEGVYTDACRVAADMAREEPEHYRSLTEDIWHYNNRSKTSDYRAAGPIVETDGDGRITGIRYNSWLRTPLRAPLDVQTRAYAAIRAFAARAQSPDYQMVFAYRPGDLLAFDNRRALHGRRSYDATGGTRFIEGAYSDRDDLYSRIRTLKRGFRAAATNSPRRSA